MKKVCDFSGSVEMLIRILDEKIISPELHKIEGDPKVCLVILVDEPDFGAPDLSCMREDALDVSFPGADEMMSQSFDVKGC